jgi:hypothetical protein
MRGRLLSIEGKAFSLGLDWLIYSGVYTIVIKRY